MRPVPQSMQSPPYLSDRVPLTEQKIWGAEDTFRGRRGGRPKGNMRAPCPMLAPNPWLYPTKLRATTSVDFTKVLQASGDSLGAQGAQGTANQILADYALPIARGIVPRPA